nr:DUF4344 domain-containing metallopeptidase [Streptomyces sp. SID3343]
MGGCTSSGDGTEDPGPPTSGPPDRRGFVIRFEEPAVADRDGAAFLRERKVMETVTATLDAFVRMDRQVTVVGRSCAGEGSAYDPDRLRIDVCYDEVAEERGLFERAGRGRADDDVAAVLVETLYHEAGHALVDVVRPTLTDRAEEDAADRFAALMLLRQGPDGERLLRSAAEEYRLAAAEGDPAAGGADEHSPDLVRAANHVCFLYGSAPERNLDLANSPLLSPARAAGCAAEWTHVRDAWTADLAPVLR